jgi:hypothetical protein
MGSLLSEMEKPRSSAAFFVSYPLLSEYQIQPERPPKYFKGIKTEALWNEGQHFGTVREKLDKFSTSGSGAWIGVFRTRCGKTRDGGFAGSQPNRPPTRK